ncbi:MAG: hypothetical protein LBM93_09350, partial [Oscillospiraceae bacterium]|nr:hypothetical protein [Oscillospiraceae bacterium]
MNRGTPEDYEEEIRASDAFKKLQLENKKLTRELKASNGIISRMKMQATIDGNVNRLIEREKIKQERYLNLLLQHSPDIIIILDEQGRFVYCTKSFLRKSNIQDFALIRGVSFSDVFALT